MDYAECVSRFKGLYSKREMFIENMTRAINKEEFEISKQWLNLAGSIDLEMSNILSRLIEIKTKE
jgi:hypothetical protein